MITWSDMGANNILGLLPLSDQTDQSAMTSFVFSSLALLLPWGLEQLITKEPWKQILSKVGGHWFEII